MQVAVETPDLRQPSGTTSRMAKDISAEETAIAIGAMRTRSNDAIARHDVGPALAILRDDVKIIVSSGQLIDGATAMAQAFERTFADPEFITFVRRPASIEVNGTTAAEAGTWEGLWKSHITCGKYLARWQHDPVGWRVAAEFYIPLGSTTGDITVFRY
jgi:ketosteroid isomerase-like protein